MSNRVIMQRREVRLICSGRKWTEVLMFETNGANASDSIELETLPDSAIDLLEMVMTKQKNMSISPAIGSLLDYMWENQKGIDIDEVWYDWEEIEHLFKKVWE